MFNLKRIVLATAAALLMSNGVTGVDSVVNSNSGNMYTVYAAENSSDDYVDQDDYATPAAEKNGWYHVRGRWYYYKNNVKLRNRFITLSVKSSNGKYVKKTYYLKADGSRASGLTYINGKLYYFSKTSNAMARGLTLVNGSQKMYFAANGAAVTKKIVKSGKYYYYFASSGRAVRSSFINYKGRIYYAAPGGTIVRNLVFRVGSDRYYAAQSGIIQKNMLKTMNKRTYYFGSNGKAVKGIRKIGKFYYYFGSDGAMKKSVWATTNGNRYYFSQKGYAYVGLHKVGGYNYYFNADGHMMKNCWKTVDGKTYYFGSDGKAYTGVHKVKGSRYYYNFSNSGYLTGGVKKVNGIAYRFDSDGKPYTGWYTTGHGNKMYYRSNGVAYTGPAKIGGKLYLFTEYGALITSDGWRIVGKYTYYLKNGGTPVTGYTNIGGNYYYFGDKGVMYQKRWAYANGYKFYFGKDGQRLIDVDAVIGKQDSYEIKVNKTLNVVTAYAKDGDNGYIIPVKAFVCSGGDSTPVGTFYTPMKGRWWTLMGPCYGQWDTLITGDILFHSVYYGSQDPTTLSVSAYNQLGTTCSHGCIRLKAGDAKWIYDNCELGTKVTIFESNEDGPFPKPSSVQLDYSHTWDPTDPTMAYKCKELGCHQGIAW